MCWLNSRTLIFAFSYYSTQYIFICLNIYTDTVEALTIGNVGDLTEDVFSADLFITLWWADQCLAYHGDVYFGTNTAVCGLKVNKKKKNSP